MKRLVILLLLLAVPLSLFAIKFPIKNEKMKNDLVLQAIFNFGFSAEAVADSLGITDYQTFYFKPAFHIQDFGIGLDFKFRFRFFAGQPPYVDQNGQPIYFRTDDWQVAGDSLATVFLYLDKINYIKYGDISKPIFVTTGEIPDITFGTGFLVKRFHNRSFMPTSRENGFYFTFNGDHLDQYGTRKLPIYSTIYITDLLDPDNFGFTFGVDLLDFSPKTDKFSLRLDLSSAFDLNIDEQNRLNADASTDVADITSHRNFVVNTKGVFGFSTSLAFGYKHKHFELKFNEEFAGLVDLGTVGGSDATFGWGNQFFVEAKMVNIKKSGFLLGLNVGLVVESPGFQSNYFSSNYEVSRSSQYNRLHTKQYKSLNTDTDLTSDSRYYNLYSINQYTFSVKTGIAFYAFQEKLQFKVDAIISLIDARYKFNDTLIYAPAVRLSAMLMLKEVIPGLTLSLQYETGTNIWIIYGSGTGVLDFLTREFRFAVDASYQFFGAKIRVLAGVQAPGRAIPVYQDVEPFMNTNAYNDALEKFVSLEVSFVL